MNSMLKRDENRLLIFQDGRKRRVLVGELIYQKSEDQYELLYDEKYRRSKRAIPMGPNLELLKRRHVSEKGELFGVFLDRIPLKDNPAYPDYCESQGISVDENNPIVLLTTIGRRGPSTFIFEPVYISNFSLSECVKLREELGITQHDFAVALDLNVLTLQRLESGKSQDPQILKRLQIYFEFPEVALWQLRQTGGRIKTRSLNELENFFLKKLKTNSSEMSRVSE